MASYPPTPRSRGSLSGLILLLLGVWGGLAPYIGPYLHFGYTPDTAWAGTPGRLYLSAVPGAVVAVGGLVAMITRSRGLGGAAALLAALGGGWFIAGSSMMRILPVTVGSGVRMGVPLAHSVRQMELTYLAFFAGIGAVMVFFAALALGRFSIGSYRDHVRFGDGDAMISPGVLAGTAGLSAPVTSPLGGYEPASYQSPGYQSGGFPWSSAAATDTPTVSRFVPGQSQYPSQYPPEPGDHGPLGAAEQDTFPQQP
jgi:hypothetical protein